MSNSFQAFLRVWVLTLVSSLALALVTLPSGARAHEVLPSVADMTRDGDVLRFEVEANLETFIAGIDQSAVTDTNEAPQAEAYDDLRALDPAALEEAFRDYWPQMADRIDVVANGNRLPLTLDSVTAGETGDVELPRTSTFVFSAALSGAEDVNVGWDRSLGALVLRQQGVEQPFDAYLTGGQTSDQIALEGGNARGALVTFFSYIPTGFDHIVPLGLDHILFVLGLFFLSTHLKPLLWQVTAFTLAHTITLALAALGIVNVPGSIVEPLIALSIAYVAIENLFTRGLSPWRPIVIFGFGLLHGLGFASVLAEFGLPQGQFVPALIGFNIGVEIGQLAVIAVAFAIVWKAREMSASATRHVGLAAAYLVGVVAVLALLIPLAAFAPGWTGDLIPVMATVAVLLGLCAVSVNLGRYDSYNDVVAQPASVLIAIVAIYWVIERVFL
ncbi:HupE/UreJ family protein [Salipiger sp. IMCC34102]|uniref:HupE/UreJ family protein n=1 Tax=Salipiger sp. IMCC34102 TaxID=2510647 RepID=UPI00101BE05B|nr:HupE/UreJ family protein [Salipiger sp. IMCC34102]RYH03131.1 HupE/UreJ family protein [Salipiger sp. IMCC34102]